MGKRLFSLALLSLGIAGCGSGDAELSKKDESALRNNFSRNLTAAEIAHMNSAKPATPPEKGK